MSDIGPIEQALRKEHLAEFIRNFGEPITEDQALCQKDFKESFDAFVISQTSEVFWSVWSERWIYWFKRHLGI